LVRWQDGCLHVAACFSIHFEELETFLLLLEQSNQQNSAKSEDV